MTADQRTLILSRSDVRRLAGVADYHRAVAAAFIAHADGCIASPPPMELPGEDGAFHAKGASGIVNGRRLAALKLNGNFPFNPERHSQPTIQGAIMLCDAVDGTLLAILDSIEITLRRTAAASAVAVDALANRDAATLLICGCGAQARAHLEAIAPLRPIKTVFVHDRDHDIAVRFADTMRHSTQFRIEAVRSPAEVAMKADIIVSVTPSKAPIIDETMAAPGVFIAAVGADNPHKNEIAAALMAKATIIADVKAQAVVMGDSRTAIAAGVIRENQIRAELGDILTGAKPGRVDDGDVIIFDSTGAAFQDLAAAAMIFARAQADGAGVSTALGA